MRDAGQRLKDANMVVVGVSPDGRLALKKFMEKEKLNFTLLSDPDHRVAEKYGVWQEKTMYGKKSWGLVRSAFLIDDKGGLMGAWYKIRPEETAELALSAL